MMSRSALIKGLVVLVAVASLLLARSVLAGKPERTKGRTPARQPAPPSSGAGSSDYRFGSVRKTLHGAGEDGWWLFEPDDPTPREAPLVIVLHGGRGMNPRDSGDWIEHLVRRGSVVIYPVFEKEDFRASQKDSKEVLIQRAEKACGEAIDFLKSSGRTRPLLDRVAMVGHSLGAAMVPFLAARAEKSGLPVPKAIMSIEPGLVGGAGKESKSVDALRNVPASVLALVVMGENDQFADSRNGDDVFRAMSQVPAAHKRFVIMRSDDHGTPPLIADHSAPLSARDDYGTPLTAQKEKLRKVVDVFTGMVPGVGDALDYNGLWKMFDRLCDAAYAGQDITAVAPGDSWEMGRWSDGTPVKPWTVTAKP